MAINMNAPGPWNNFKPPVNAPIATPTISFNKPSPAPVTTVSYNPPTGPIGNAPIRSKPFQVLKPPKPTGVGLSFSVGG